MKVLVVLCALAAATFAKPGYLAPHLPLLAPLPAIVAPPPAPAFVAPSPAVVTHGILAPSLVGPAPLPALPVPVPHVPAVPALPAVHPVPAIPAPARVVPASDVVPAAVNGLTPFGVPIDTPAVQYGRALDAAVHINTKGAHYHG